MKRAEENRVIGRILGWVAAMATVIVTPWFAIDPINVPKLAVISAGGFMCFAYLVIQRKHVLDLRFRTPLIVIALFLVDLFLVLIFAGSNFNQEFFGTYGRATGFVAYVALTGLLAAGVVYGSQSNLVRVSWFLLGTGLLSALYGVIQALGADPIKWVNGYSPVIGFLGNPDFQSSFVAFSAVMAVAMVLSKELSRVQKSGLLVFMAVAIYVIKQTQAQQGFLVLLGGIGVIALIYMYKSKAKILTIPLLSGGVIGLVLVVMGSLNSGPLASVLHKASVIYRGDYWRAGWEMTTSHPIFGVGLDSYGDWYRRARTLAATVRRGPDVTSNAAHNVLLDFSSNGGFPLLIIYLVLVALVIRAAMRVIRRGAQFEPVFTGLFAVWIAYQAQSIISLNQLGLAVWGWIISGLIIGYEISGQTFTQEEVQPHKKARIAPRSNQSSTEPRELMALFSGFLVGLLFGLPPLIASSHFKSALESGDKKVITNAVTTFPQDASLTIQIAYLFHQNKLDAEALSILSTAAKKYPDTYDVWKIIAALENASPAQVEQAKAQLKRLDPHNAELK